MEICHATVWGNCASDDAYKGNWMKICLHCVFACVREHWFVCVVYLHINWLQVRNLHTSIRNCLMCGIIFYTNSSSIFLFVIVVDARDHFARNKQTNIFLLTVCRFIFLWLSFWIVCWFLFYFFLHCYSSSSFFLLYYSMAWVIFIYPSVAGCSDHGFLPLFHYY